MCAALNFLPEFFGFLNWPVKVFLVVLISQEYLVSISPVHLTQNTSTTLSPFQSLVRRGFWAFQWGRPAKSQSCCLLLHQRTDLCQQLCSRSGLDLQNSDKVGCFYPGTAISIVQHQTGDNTSIHLFCLYSPGRGGQYFVLSSA